MKKRIWIVIKLRFFINLEIIEEADKKKKLYLFFKKIYKYCYNLRHIRPLFFQCNIRLLQFKMHQTFFFNGVIKNKKNQITLCLHCYNLSCIRLFLCKFFLLKSKKKKKKKKQKKSAIWCLHLVQSRRPSPTFIIQYMKKTIS